MNSISAGELSKIICNIQIPNIPEDTNFWLVRSKGGFFYDEFVKEKFVALGWNFISQETSFNSNNIEILKTQIKERYGDQRPGVAIGKCRRFIEDVKHGDYILIPNMGGTEVAICIAGEYYELDFDYRKEIEVIKKIENNEFEVGKVRCPYKKRRRISVVMTMPSKRLGYKLLRGMSSYHGISDMGDYAVEILNCIYDCYSYKEDIRCSINIAKNTPIKARELSKLMYSMTELFCKLTEEELVSITINLNSPGKITIALSKGYQFLRKGAVPLLIIYVMLFGGKILGFEFNGISTEVIDAVEKARTLEVNIDIKEEQLQGLRLDNYRKAMEVIQMSEETEISTDDILNELKVIEELNESLQFKSNQDFAEYVDDVDEKK